MVERYSGAHFQKDMMLITEGINRLTVATHSAGNAIRDASIFIDRFGLRLSTSDKHWGYVNDDKTSNLLALAKERPDCQSMLEAADRIAKNAPLAFLPFSHSFSVLRSFPNENGNAALKANGFSTAGIVYDEAAEMGITFANASWLESELYKFTGSTPEDAFYNYRTIHESQPDQNVIGRSKMEAAIKHALYLCEDKDDHEAIVSVVEKGMEAYFQNNFDVYLQFAVDMRPSREFPNLGPKS